MSNRIAELLEQLKKDKGMTVPEFAKKCDLAPTTIYSARSKPTMEHIHVDVFLKIAKGLGMTAEELYYGEEQERTYADEREGELHRIWNDLDEERRGRLIGDARDMEVAKSNENHSVQTEEVAK